MKQLIGYVAAGAIGLLAGCFYFRKVGGIC